MAAMDTSSPSMIMDELSRRFDGQQRLNDTLHNSISETAAVAGKLSSLCAEKLRWCWCC